MVLNIITYCDIAVLTHPLCTVRICQFVALESVFMTAFHITYLFEL